MDRKRLEARLNLARHFFQHSLRRLFAADDVDGDGVRDFLNKYAPDNIFQIEDFEREHYHTFGRCIQCSLCQPHCVMYRALGYLDFPGPMAVASTLSRGLSEVAAASGVIYNCTQCRLCETTCPENVPIAEMVGFLRKYIYAIAPESVPKPLRELCDEARRRGSIFDGEPVTPVREKRTAEYVLFLGCHSLYRQQQRTAAVISMLDRMAIDFTMIDEVCCGAPLAAVGCEPSGQLAAMNIERIREKNTAKVLTVCPHCHVSFLEGREYAGKIEPVHIAELLPQLHPARSGQEPVAYHDPCMLGRVCGIFEEPRKALGRAGANLVELETTREMAFCCGHWGGLGYSARETSEAIAAKRLEDARNAGAAVLLTECPWCLDIFRSTALAGGKPRIRSVVEYLQDPET